MALGLALSGRSEHSPLRVRTGRSVVRGKSSSLARPDTHQGLFHERNNFGSGLTLTLCCLTTGDRDVALEEEVKPAIEGDYFHNGMK